MMKALGVFCILTLSSVVGCAVDPGEVSQPPSTDAPALEKSEAEAKFIHTVLFWMKDGTTEEQKQQLIQDCREFLGPISSVRFLAAGMPAMTPRTEVVDNSYGVGLVVHFEDRAGHDLYQEAPKHLEFIERNQAIWERVQVYDIQLP